jgi:hypothetical protein
MERNTAIILTVTSVLLCACPGILICVMGAGFITYSGSATTIDNNALLLGMISLICGSSLTLVPVGVALAGFGRRQGRRKPVTVRPEDLHDDLPPAI